MRMKKLIALGLVTAMTVTSLVACGTKSTNNGNTATATPSGTTEPKKVTLTVWGPQEDQAPLDGYSDGILKAMCDKFNEAHPEWDITFEYGVCSEGDAKDLVTKDVAAAADVYMFANDQIPVLVEAGAIAQLGGKVVDDIKANNSQAMVDSVTYNDGVYGVPFTSNTWFMYYDKSKFTEDEVKSLDTMMSKDLGSDISNFAFPLENSWYIASFYYAAGGTLFGPNGSDAAAGCTFGGDTGAEVTKYLVDLAANKKFSVERDGSSIAKFKDGKLGAYCSGSWDAAAIKEALGDNFGVTKVPTVTINGTEGQMKSFAGSKAIGANPMSKNPEVAVALAAYLGSDEAQQIRFDARGIAPTNKNVAASESVQKDAVVAAQALEINEAAVVQPVLAEMNSYWSPAETMGKEITQGTVTKDNAAEKTEAMVKGITSSGL